LTWLIWVRRFTPDPAAWLADAFGIGLALTAAMGMLTFFSGWVVSGGFLALVYSLLGLAFVIGLLIRVFGGMEKSAGVAAEPAISDTQIQLHPPSHWLRLGLWLPLLIFGALLVFRFIQSAELALPAWVDSVHHALLVRLIAEAGRVPASFEPYMPVSLYYHFGFHANAALFSRLAQLTAEQSLLIFGQIVNAVVGLAVYRLAIALWGDWRRGVVAMVFVGFIFQMPGYYLTWGRYTLLTGLILLALAMAAAVELSRAPGWHRAILLAVFTLGTLLVHYFAAILLAVFYALVLIARFWTSGRRNWRDRPIWLLLGSGLAAVIISSPWLLHVLRESQAFISLNVVTPGQDLDAAYFSNYWGYLGFLLGPRRSHLVHSLALALFMLLAWRPPNRVLAVWTLIIGVLSLPWGLHLEPFRPDHGVIIAFLPAALFFGDFFGSLLDTRVEPRLWIQIRIYLAVLFVLLVGWGIRDMRRIVNPITNFAKQADLEALHWIDENVPQDARFFINTTRWLGGAYRGIDGGWWIQPVTGRETIVPPLLYIQGDVDWVWDVIEQGGKAAALQGCTPEFWDLTDELGLDYVYLGLSPGAVTLEQLQLCPGVELIYTSGGVHVFQLHR
jgi:hypothetical protein